jgi:Mg2+ and Co2+ transporter CorA
MNQKLKKQYEIVRNHPIMLGTGQNFMSFGKELDKLLDIFYKEINSKFPQYKGTMHIFWHQFATVAYALEHCNPHKPRYYYKDRHEYVIQACQIYIVQVHAYLDTDVFDEFKLHVQRRQRIVHWSCPRHYYIVTYKWRKNKWILTHTYGETSECECIGKKL